jgi:UDP-4-amino-4,6-dideoxy-N-acetyl-beta-L-altrosamine transaminase
MENEKFSFIPYSKQTIEEDDIKAVEKVLRSDFLTTGPKVKEFEKALCDYTGAKYAVAVSNGTAALHLAALILLNPQDLVLTTPNSFLATSNSILYADARPIFVDIKEDGNIDLDKCIKLLEKNKNIKALFGVHFSGNPLEVEKLKYIKETFNIKILEDAAHALGATYELRIENGKWKINKVGNSLFSDITIFSFHPVKHITTAEGGAILTNDEEIYKKALRLRNHGINRDGNWQDSELEKGVWYYEMVELGYNYRISDIQCALGISQLKKLDKFLQKRREIAKRYDKAFENTLIKPLYKFNPHSAYHLYVVRVDFNKVKITKAKLFEKMRKRGIFLQLHYIPINKQPFYKSLGYGNENLSNTYRYYKEAFSIPIYPGLSEEEQEYVINSLKECL